MSLRKASRREWNGVKRRNLQIFGIASQRSQWRLADRTNTNSLDTSNTSGVNSTQASVLGSSNDKNVLSTENLFTAKSSSSTSCLPDLVIENATNPERAIASTKIQISSTLKNIGSKDAGRHFVGYYLSQDEKWDTNDKLLETNSFDTVQSLKAGESISLVVEMQAHTASVSIYPKTISGIVVTS